MQKESPKSRNSYLILENHLPKSTKKIKYHILFNKIKLAMS